jgi:hypothetical protein
MRRKKRLKVGMLVNIINRYTSEVMPEIYIITYNMSGGVWQVSPVSDMTITRHYHTKQLVEVKCE